ncbi:SET domain-containing protein SmydA-8 [Musca vetustissima]|uniref:SET domain-containing protein SmydA-8 n=1 Tax=Musca vetustissima TaxID=27455 RepID=UPI002AB5E5D1|nr:SET domain-containing protein SmydA-8 [Musca vetustissima]
MPNKKNKNKKKHHHNYNRPESHYPVEKDPLEEQLQNLQISENGSGPTKPYRIEVSEIVGRYLVANRNLKPGEILIKEKALAIGPCVSADPVCLGCYMPVTLKATQYRCSSCNWPMCGPHCRGLHKETGHTAEECDLFRRENTATPLTPTASPVRVKNLYELVMVVRILLKKQHNPELYERIMVMESHLEMRKQNAELWSHYESNVVTYLRDTWHLAEQFTADEIHTVCGILDVNCFEIGQNLAKARTLYPSAFLLAHDCCPNTSHTDDPETFDIILRTSRSVRKDEAITLSYAYTLQGTLKRRDFMQAGKLFWCCCKRCSDPYELGSDCSAIVCDKCHKGLIRSTNPLDQEADWKCDQCPFVLQSHTVVKLLDKINNDLDAIDAHDIPGLENFLKRYSGVLGPNHYLLLSAKYSLCQLYGKIEGYLLPELSLEDLQRKLNYCQDFLKVVDILEPQLTRLRGLIMYELHAPMLMLAQRQMMLQLCTRRDFNKAIKEVIYLLKESAKILKMEPPGSAEHQMGVAAEDALEKMGVQ